MPGRRRRRQGFWRYPRYIEYEPPFRVYAPLYAAPPARIVLTLSELEAMRLVYVEGLTQEEAAARMGISRKTLWNDLKNGRKKLINAILKGYAIEIRAYGDVIGQTRIPR